MEKLIKSFKYLLTFQFAKLFSALSKRIPGSVYKHAKAYILEKGKMSQDLNDTPTMNSRNDFEFRICQKGDLLGCSKLLDIPAEECYKRIDNGDYCFAAFQGNKMVNVIWVHHGPFYLKGFGYYENSNENISYLYNSITDPNSRGKGLYKTSIYLISNILFQNGSTKLIAIVLPDNQIVLNVLSNMGFRKIKIISHLTIMGIQYTAVQEIGSKDVGRKIFIRLPKGVYVI